MRTILIAVALASTVAASAMAQDTKSTPTPSSTSTPIATPAAASILLTEQERKDWIDKPIYSSDGVRLGEVVLFQRDPSNKVLGMHADIGGFLGYMQSRVNVMPAQFKLQGDRVVLGITAEQVKSLPKVQI